MVFNHFVAGIMFTSSDNVPNATDGANFDIATETVFVTYGHCLC